MAETIGSIIDKLTIIQLRHWHVNERILDPNTADAIRQTCRERLPLIEEQQRDLCLELEEMWQALLGGAKPPKVYRQFKMYNDPALRGTSD